MKKYIFCLLAAASLFACEEDPTPARIDLEVKEINFELEKYTSTTGHVTVTGIIENVGQEDFVSGEGQQVIYLNMVPLGLTDYGDPEASVEFETLEVGETIEIEFETEWDMANEFQPTFVVHIGYDPDLYLDGNELNDDADSSNDKLERSGYDINDMF